MSKINSDTDLMRNLLENFGREPNYAAMKGPGDFGPPEEGPVPMPKVEEALGELSDLSIKLRKISSLYGEDKTRAAQEMNKFINEVDRYLDNAYGAFEEGGDTKSLMNISDQFNEVAYDEQGELVQIKNKEQLAKVILQTNDTLEDVERKLEDFLDQ